MLLKKILETPKTKTPQKVVAKKLPLLDKLFAGGKYGVKEKKELKNKFSKLSDSDKIKAKVVLNAMVSTAKGKKTNITRTDIKELV